MARFFVTTSSDGSHMERVIELGGDEVHLGPISPGDADAIRDGLSRMSKESRYRRFLDHTESLSSEKLHYLTHADGYNHIAWGARVPREDGGFDGIGVARCIRDKAEPTHAEFAIAVVDDWQRRGVGHALAHEVVCRAWDLGIRYFRGFMLAENRPAFALMARFADVVSRRVESPGVLEVLFRLRPPD